LTRQGPHALEPAIDTGGPMGRMVLTVLGVVAEMELGFIRDRQRAGIDVAKAKGIYKGRPATFDRARLVSLRKEGMGRNGDRQGRRVQAWQRVQDARGCWVEPSRRSGCLEVAWVISRLRAETQPREV
jgi:DNA invertase Pin-like site-specific DNA recombinase